MQNNLDTLASVARAAGAAGGEVNGDGRNTSARSHQDGSLPAGTDAALLLHLIALFKEGGQDALVQAPQLLASSAGSASSQTVSHEHGLDNEGSRAAEQQTRTGRVPRAMLEQNQGRRSGPTNATNGTPAGTNASDRTNGSPSDTIVIGNGRAARSAGARFQANMGAVSTGRGGSTTPDAGEPAGPIGGPGPSTIASRKRKRATSTALTDHSAVEFEVDEGGNPDEDDDDDDEGNDGAYADLNDEINLMDAGENSDDQGDSNDPDADSGGKQVKRRRGGQKRRLDPAEALRRRKERNKKAAQISRDQRKAAQEDLTGKLRVLEREHVDLISRYHALEQEHQRVLAENTSLKAERKSRPAATSGLPVTDPNSTENTITINGISLNLDQYLALSSLRPRNAVTRAVAAQLGIAAEAGEDDDEDEDADFHPSSPVGGDDTPGRDTDAGTMDNEEDDHTPKATADGNDDDGDGDGDFLTEAPSSRGWDEEDFEEDDDHFVDEDMDDEELFLPIEDVPIPEGEPERLQAAYHQQASTNEVLLQQLKQAQSTEPVTRSVAPIINGFTPTVAHTGAVAGTTAMQAALTYAQLTGHPAPHPAPQVPPQRPTLGGSTPLPLAQPATSGGPPNLDTLANILNHPGIASNPVVVKHLLEAYGVTPPPGTAEASDRGQGLGRGAHGQLDQGALARQLLIMSQTQNQPRY